MIIVITHKERIGKTNRHKLLVSHGTNIETDEMIILPQVPVAELPGISYCADIGEYIIEGESYNYD